MQVEIRKESGYWSVFVNGQRMVDRESFAVADRIVDELKQPGCHYPSESWEVAESIRRYMEAR